LDGQANRCIIKLPWNQTLNTYAIIHLFSSEHVCSQTVQNLQENCPSCQSTYRIAVSLFENPVSHAPGGYGALGGTDPFSSARWDSKNKSRRKTDNRDADQRRGVVVCKVPEEREERVASKNKCLNRRDSSKKRLVSQKIKRGGFYAGSGPALLCELFSKSMKHLKASTFSSVLP